MIAEARHWLGFLGFHHSYINQMKYFFYSVLMLLGSLGAMAQTSVADSIRVVGAVYDADSLSILPNSMLFYQGKYYSPTVDGHFSLMVKKGDFVRFLHMGYKDAQILVSDSLYDENYLMGVFLSQDTIRLPEVIVVSRYDRLAIQARYMPVVMSPSMINASQNIRKSTHVALTTAPSRMDAEMNQSMVLSEKTRDIVYRGMISPDRILGVGSEQLTVIMKGLTERDKELRRTDRAPMTKSEIDYMLYLYRQSLNKLNK